MEAIDDTVTSTDKYKELILHSFTLNTSGLEQLLRGIDLNASNQQNQLKILQQKVGQLEELNQTVEMQEKRIDTQQSTLDKLEENLNLTKRNLSEKELKVLNLEEKLKEALKRMEETRNDFITFESQRKSEIQVKTVEIKEQPKPEPKPEKLSIVTLEVPEKKEEEPKPEGRNQNLTIEDSSLEINKSSDSQRQRQTVRTKTSKNTITKMSLHLKSTKSLVKVEEPEELTDMSVWKTKFSQINLNFDKINRVLEDNQRNFKVQF